MAEESVKRILMAKKVAKSWLLQNVQPHYRIVAYLSIDDSSKNIPSLLQGFRNGKLKLASVPPIPDLGMKVEFDSVSVWSSNREAMLKLDAWFQSKGCETIGVW